MFHRWLIRSFFIALCALCAAAWVGSYFQEAWVCYLGGNHYQALGVDRGSVYLHGIYSDPGFGTARWEWHRQRADPEGYEASYLGSTYQFAGFAYTPYTSHHWFLQIPLWLPTALSALLLWFACRRTRPKPMGAAFPVEPAAKATECST